MIEVKETPQRFHLQFTPIRPAIYLDHFAIVKLARDCGLGNRFLSLLGRQGTLLFSWASAWEIAGNAGDDVSRIRSFLERVGPNWAPVEIDAEKLIAREAAWKPGNDAPYLAFGLMKDFFPSLFGAGTMNLGGLVDAVQKEPTRTNVRTALDGMKDDVSANHNKMISIWQKDAKHMNRISAVLEWNRMRPAFFVHRGLIRLLGRSNNPFSRNDAVDFCHAVVALAHADIAVLDGKWASLGEGLHGLGMPDDHVTIFSGREGQLDLFLNCFKTWPELNPHD